MIIYFIPHIILFLLLSYVLSVFSYNYVIHEEGSTDIRNEDEVIFYVYRKMTIDVGPALWYSEPASSEKECFDLCYKTKCTDMNIKEITNNSFECHIITGKCIRRYFKSGYTKSYVSTNKRFSTSYCINLRYLNPCGDCECIDEVNSDVQYYCNCTKENHLRSSCAWVKQNAVNKVAVTGVYQLKHGTKKLNGLCIFKRSGKVELLIFKRINGGMRKFVSDFKTGFGKIGHTWSGAYFIGLDYLHHITSKGSENVTLKMEFVEENTMEHNILLYTEFKVDSEANGYQISYIDYHYEGKNEVYKHDFLAKFANKKFGLCTHGYWWNDRNCGILLVDHHPFHFYAIHWRPKVGDGVLTRLKITWTLITQEP